MSTVLKSRSDKIWLTIWTHRNASFTRVPFQSQIMWSYFIYNWFVQIYDEELNYYDKSDVFVTLTRKFFIWNSIKFYNLDSKQLASRSNEYNVKSQTTIPMPKQTNSKTQNKTQNPDLELAFQGINKKFGDGALMSLVMPKKWMYPLFDRFIGNWSVLGFWRTAKRQNCWNLRSRIIWKNNLLPKCNRWSPMKRGKCGLCWCRTRIRSKICQNSWRWPW